MGQLMDACSICATASPNQYILAHDQDIAPLNEGSRAIYSLNAVNGIQTMQVWCDVGTLVEARWGSGAQHYCNFR